MIKIEHVKITGWKEAIRGMRNPMNSWGKSDSGICKGGDNGIGCGNCVEYDCGHKFDKLFKLGKADYRLMNQLVIGGPVHAKYRRMITVYLDITAPLYWWKEFDTYKVGTVANSCSTMHKIAEKRFEREDFSIEHLENCDEQHWMVQMDNVISALNVARERYLETKDKKYWWQMIQLLPSSYNQRRTIMLNYEVLAGIYPMRKNHKLDEWREFCQWIESLPYSEIITGSNKTNNNNSSVQESIEEMLERIGAQLSISSILEAVLVTSRDELTSDEQEKLNKELKERGITKNIIYISKQKEE